ncbi:tRNA (guanosine(46)-N7)-methyltransferase TrmB [soil metagenome]
MEPDTPPNPRMPDLSPYLLDLDALQSPIRWPDLFGNEQPVEFEVGPGKGLFLANAATRQPGHNFLGVELARKYARKAAERVAKRGLTNVRVVVGDARRMLKEFVPPASLVAVHVYFPDPWWKKRHKKRRVFNETLFGDIERTLQPGGDLYIVSDVEEYFEVMTALVANRPAFALQARPEPNTPEHDLDYLTNFERKFRIEGRPIHRQHYRRK